MKKSLFFLATLLTMFLSVSIPCSANAADLLGVYSDQQLQGGTDKDRDGDGLITYGELSIETRKLLKKGYTAGLRNSGFGYEMMYVAEDPVVRVIGTTPARNDIPSYKQYHSQVSRTRSYYNVISSDRTKYPRDTYHWFVTDAWEIDGEWYAEVNYTANATNLTTPETISFDGNKCKVVGLNLTNTNVRVLTITDNITYIKACRCPNLTEVIGGSKVYSIGNFAFKDCIYLVNFPYFPYLEKIGDFAFEGCFNLSEVLLPPSISYISGNAFGWYDAVQGNYDYFNLRGDEDDYAYSMDVYASRERILGVTLYAAKNTATWDTINRLYVDKEAGTLGMYINVDEKNNYPGPFTIEIIEDVEEYEEWLPKVGVGEGIDWPDLDFDISDIGTLSGSVSEDSKVCIEYLMDMVVAGDINEDMFYSLICAMTGFGDIPREFIVDHQDDPELVKLGELYAAAVKKQLKIQELKLKGDTELSAQLQEKMFQARMKNMEYVKKGFENLQKLYTSLKDPTDKVGLGKLTKVTEMLNHINNFFAYVNAGDSYLGAMNKAAMTGTYMTLVATYAPSPVGAFEAVVAILFGNSKAKDAASIIGTGKHAIEFYSDLVYTSFYDAMINSNQFTPARRWDAFCTLWAMNVKEVLKDLEDLEHAKYGQNLSNFTYLMELYFKPEDQKYIFLGYVDMFAQEKFWSNFCQDSYDVFVEGNDTGKLLYDYVVQYYSATPDILSDRTKELEALVRKTKGKK